MEWKPKWVKLPILEFSREVLAMRNDHGKMAEWLMEFTNALMLGNNESGCELANRIIDEATAYVNKKSEAGRKGGIASANARGHRFDSSIPLPRRKKEVLDFAQDMGLDVDDARVWWEQNFVERPGCDRDGVVFENWKGALVNYCRAEAKRR